MAILRYYVKKEMWSGLNKAVINNQERSSFKQFVMGFKRIGKGFVVLANVFPVIVGYWLALHCMGADLVMRLEVFVFVTIIFLLVISGDLICINWYTVDIVEVIV